MGKPPLQRLRCRHLRLLIGALGIATRLQQAKQGKAGVEWPSTPSITSAPSAWQCRHHSAHDGVDGPINAPPPPPSFGAQSLPRGGVGWGRGGRQNDHRRRRHGNAGSNLSTMPMNAKRPTAPTSRRTDVLAWEAAQPTMPDVQGGPTPTALARQRHFANFA